MRYIFDKLCVRKHEKLIECPLEIYTEHLQSRYTSRKSGSPVGAAVVAAAMVTVTAAADRGETLVSRVRIDHCEEPHLSILGKVINTLGDILGSSNHPGTVFGQVEPQLQ